MVILENNNGYKWETLKNIKIRGEISSIDRLKETQKAIDLFFEINDNINEFEKLLQRIDGFFSMVIETENAILACVDRVRSMPLFYLNDGKEFRITDTLDINKLDNPQISNLHRDIYLNSGYVLGDNTLLANFMQLEAGQILKFDKKTKEITKKSYFNFEHKNFHKKLSKDDLISEMQQVYFKTFEKLIKQAKQRYIIVPLSAGHDSRLIVHMLKKLNYNNVICFSYGKKGNLESEISKKVAKKYGYKWLFVEYTKKQLYDLYNSEYKDYASFSANLSSVVHTQDLLAVKLLKEKHLIPKDVIFVPGHSGDMVAGSHIPKDFIKELPQTSASIADYTFRRHFNILKLEDESVVKKIKLEIEKNITSKTYETPEAVADEIEKWNWKERQCKYICNSIKIYEFYGYEWLLPLWSLNIMDFWSKIPVDYRIGRKLYFEYAEKEYGSEIPINPVKNKLCRLYDKIFDVWYGRFINTANNLSIFIIPLKKKIDIKINYVDTDKKIFSFSKVGLNVLISYINIIKKSN